MIIWWQVMSEIFALKIIRIGSFFFKLHRKCRGCFFCYTYIYN